MDSNNIVALIGENGSGKSTLLKSIAKIENINNGKILINNEEDFSKLTDVLFIPDKIILPKSIKIINIIKILENSNSEYDRAYALDFLNFLEIQENEKLKNLSKGTQELLQLGILIANKPKFLLLDEPLTAIDLIKREYIYNKLIDLNDDGVGIILSSHIANEIQNIFSSVIILKDSKIIKSIAVEEIYNNGYQDVNSYIKENI